MSDHSPPQKFDYALHKAMVQVPQYTYFDMVHRLTYLENAMHGIAQMLDVKPVITQVPNAQGIYEEREVALQAVIANNTLANIGNGYHFPPPPPEPPEDSPPTKPTNSAPRSGGFRPTLVK